MAMSQDMLSVSDVDDIDNLEILESIERRKRTVHSDRMNDLDCMDNVAFRSRYRLNKNTVESLIQMLDDTLSAPSDKNNALTTTEKILVALRFYATGSHQMTVGDLSKVSQPSASRAVNEVSKAIASLRPNYIRLPQTTFELRQISQEFYSISGFPAVYGAIDCTHIPIISPGGDLAEVFRCRKGFFSLNVQTVSDPALCIRDIVACWPGSTHDSTIFDNSHLRAIMETEISSEYHLLGDNGYGCRSYLLTPFLNPATPQQIRYNAAHTSARNVVEKQYGVMKRRFACLDYLRCSLQNAMTIIVAVAILHNIAMNMGDLFEGRVEEEDDDDIVVDHAAGIAKRNALLTTFFNN